MRRSADREAPFDWVPLAVAVAVGVPLVWLLMSGGGGHFSAWLITALVAAIGVRAILRSNRNE